METAHAHGAVILVADHDRAGSAPFLVGELPRVDKIDVRFEGGLEPVFPGHQLGDDGQAVRVQLVEAGLEHVAHAALVAEHGDLPRADGQRRAAVDDVALHREFVDELLVGVIFPFDNFQ